MMNRWYKIFPFLEWFERYGREHFKNDLFAGLTVSLVLIPQSMAYAQLAGLPSYYGLYASLLPPIVAALFGSSRQLATGPVAVVSLMTAVAIEPLATAGGPEFITYAILLSLVVGLFQFTLGVLRLGLVINFLSHPVINGFTNAAALIIASAQLAQVFGVQVDKADHHYQTIVRVFQEALHYTHWPTFLMAAFAFLAMLGIKKVSPRIPAVLIVVVFTTLASWAFDFERQQVVTLDDIADTPLRGVIAEYNRLVEEIDDLVAARSQWFAVQRAAVAGEDAIRRIAANREIEIAEVNLSFKRDAAAAARQAIRRHLLRRARPASGSPRFFAAESLPEGVVGEKRIWRIRVGGHHIDPQAITVASGGTVVGHVPRGLPSLSFPRFDLGIVGKLVEWAAIIALLGFMEAISVAKAMAARTGQRIDPNQELIGQGLANMLGALVKSYPCAGSFSRSALNLQSGAQTGMASIIASLAVVAALYFFTPVLYYLPQAVLAAIIMLAVVGLINVKGFVHAWRAQRYDGCISVLTFVCTLLFAPHLDKGILVGVVLSLGVFLYKSMRPKVVDLALGGDMAFHDVVIYGLQECKYIDVVRFDGPLFFANAAYLEDQIRNRRHSKKALKHIIIAADGINDIDASGEEVLSLIIDRVRRAGIDISFSGLNESVMAVLERTHLLAKIGRDHVYPTMKTAIGAVHERTHRGGLEKNCPLTTVSSSGQYLPLKGGGAHVRSFDL